MRYKYTCTTILQNREQKERKKKILTYDLNTIDAGNIKITQE